MADRYIDSRNTKSKQRDKLLKLRTYTVHKQAYIPGLLQVKLSREIVVAGFI